MAYTSYTYSLSSDFPNSSASIARLTKEVNESLSITVKLSGISNLADDIILTFMSALTGSEESALDAIIAAHSGAPLPETVITRTSPEKPDLNEEWFHSYNWCDPTTWYQRSIRVNGEVLSPIDDDRTRFKMRHDNIIDLVHGKYPQEDLFSAPYIAKVYVDGVLKYEDTPLSYDNEKRDYCIDYNAGFISFNSPIPANAVVTADYSWAKDSTYSIVPRPGKKLLMQDAEAEFTSDFDMRDTVIYQAFVYAQVASQLGQVDLPTLQYVLTLQYGGTRDALMTFLGLVDGYGEPLQRDLQPFDKVPIDLETRVYKTYWDFKAQSNGNYPVLPALGGPLRGTRSSSITHPFNYRGRKTLDSTIGAEARVWLKNHIPFGSKQSMATATFYCLEEDV